MSAARTSRRPVGLRAVGHRPALSRNNAYGGLDVSDAGRLKALEDDNAKLKKLLAGAMRCNVASSSNHRSPERPVGASAGSAAEGPAIVLAGAGLIRRSQNCELNPMKKVLDIYS
jgi:hypothetical protein